MRADEPVTNAEMWDVFRTYFEQDQFDLEAIVFWMDWE